MKPSPNCYGFIEKEEGCVLHPYLDDAGVPTIGIGCTMYQNGKHVTMKDPVISHEKALELLQWEVKEKSDAVQAATSKIKLTQNQFDALVSFAYNAGTGALKQSTLLKTILANPGEARTIRVEDMQDESVRHWMQKQNIRAIPLITYYFSLWCKITVEDEITKQPKKILSDGLIRRRLREAALYQRA